MSGTTRARAVAMGAWLGASLGVEAIPEEWRKRLAAYDRIHECIEAILRVRAGNESAVTNEAIPLW